MTGTRGQASIEVLGFLPLVGLIALVAFTFVASHTAGEQAGEAAEAGALMLLQGGGDPARPPRRPARRTPCGRQVTVDAVRGRATITLDGRASTCASGRASRSRASPTASPARPAPTRGHRP